MYEQNGQNRLIVKFNMIMVIITKMKMIKE